VIIKKPNLEWNIGFILASNRTVLKSLQSPDGDPFSSYLIGSFGPPGGGSIRGIKLEEGAPIGQFFGPVFQGVNDGQWVFEDLNRDQYYCYCESDWTSHGQGLPKKDYAIRTTLNWKGFDLDLHLRGVAGHSIIDEYNMIYGVPNSISSYNVSEVIFDEPVNTLTDYWRFSDYYIENASFLRLDNATVGYTFNQQKIKPINDLRLYITVQNLFTISGFSGLDPEPVLKSENVFMYNSLTPGILDSNTYYLNRTFVFGLQMII
jgi:iron complex outermembrane receptor protein